jgi:hypothetical protein
MDTDGHKLKTPAPERQEQARRYAYLCRRLIPVSIGLGLIWALRLLLRFPVVTGGDFLFLLAMLGSQRR